MTSITNNAVYAYSLAGSGEPKLIGEVALPVLRVAGHGPISTVANWVTFTPDGRTVYVSNAGNRSVSAIDTKAMKLVATVPVGEVPKRIGTLVIPDAAKTTSSSTSRPAGLGRRASLH